MPIFDAIFCTEALLSETINNRRMKFQLYTPQAINELGKRKNQEDTIYPLVGEATADDRLFLV